jgi:uncharacterized coiled-coil protein SlyX
MKRKMIAWVLAAVCVLSFSTLGWAAAPPEGDQNTADSAKLDKITEQLKTLQQSLQTIRNQITDLSLSSNRAVADLKARMDSLERQMNTFEERMNNMRRSFAPPETGTIRLVNRSLVPATIFINGAPHRLEAGESRDLQNQAAGVFTYSVHAEGFGVIQSQVNRTLLTDRVFTIYINP